MRAHVSDGSGLPGRSCRCDRSRSAHFTRSATPGEPAADLSGNAKLATGEPASARDRIAGTAVIWSFRLEQPEHAFRAVRCPRRDDPTLGCAQRLRRTHTQSFPTADDRFVP
jgi:hypothetical protein